MVLKLQCIPLQLHSPSSFSKSHIGGWLGDFQFQQLYIELLRIIYLSIYFTGLFSQIFFLLKMVLSTKGYDLFKSCYSLLVLHGTGTSVVCHRQGSPEPVSRGFTTSKFSHLVDSRWNLNTFKVCNFQVMTMYISYDAYLM